MKYAPPNQLNLQAICEQWHVFYEKVPQSRTTLKKITHQSMPYDLIVRSPSKKYQDHITALENFLKQKAKRHLGTWLQAISDDMNLPFNRCTIRGQRTRWGSCTENDNINLNYKLLFLPASLTEYVLLHELCHTKELNHSKRFWSLVESYIPDYRRIDRALKKALQHIPPCWR